jgi:hypothetical protein
MLEDFREARLDPLRDVVVSVSRQGPTIGPHESLKNRGAGAHDVVAGKIHESSPRGVQPRHQAAHVKNIDLSAQTFIIKGKREAFVTFRAASLKLLSKIFVNPLVRQAELWQFAQH